MSNPLNPNGNTAAYSLYDKASQQTWLAKTVTAQAVSYIEHNSGIISLAMLMDAISNPLGVAGSTDGTLAYAKVPYAGSVTSYIGQDVPVVGWLNAPADAEGQKWWGALYMLIWRLGTGLKPGPAGDPAVPSTAALFEVRGVGADAIVRSDRASASVLYLEPEATAHAVAGIYAAAHDYAMRRLAIAQGQPVPAPTADELAESANVEQLSSQYQSNRTRGLFGAVVGLAAAAGSLFLAAKYL